MLPEALPEPDRQIVGDPSRSSYPVELRGEADLSAGLTIVVIGIMIDTMPVAKNTSRTRARVFWTGRSQAVRLPKEFRFATDSVLVRREGTKVILEPDTGWPEGYLESFAGMPKDFERPPQGSLRKRAKL